MLSNLKILNKTIKKADKANTLKKSERLAKLKLRFSLEEGEQTGRFFIINIESQSVSSFSHVLRLLKRYESYGVEFEDFIVRREGDGFLVVVETKGEVKLVEFFRAFGSENVKIEDDLYCLDMCEKYYFTLQDKYLRFKDIPDYRDLIIDDDWLDNYTKYIFEEKISDEERTQRKNQERDNVLQFEEEVAEVNSLEEELRSIEEGIQHLMKLHKFYEGKQKKNPERRLEAELNSIERDIEELIKIHEEWRVERTQILNQERIAEPKNTDEESLF